MSSDILGSDTAMQLGELGGNVDNLINICRAYLQRRWLSDHGVMPELFELIAETSNDEPASEVVDQHLIHHKALVNLLVPLISKLTKRNNAISSILEKIGAEEESDNSDSDADSDLGGGDNGDEGDGEGGFEGDSDEAGGGFDDFGDGDSDLGGFEGGEEGGDDAGSDNQSDDPTKSADEGTDDIPPEEEEEPEPEDKEEPAKDDTDKKAEEADKEADEDLGGFKG